MRALSLMVALLLGCSAPPPPRHVAPAPTRPALVTRAQTEREAFDYLWIQLGQMPFFKARGYRIGLPADPLFQQLAESGAAGADREEARRVFADKVYDPHAFDAGLRVLSRVPDRIGPALDAFATWERAWGFQRRARYELLLTLYGPGGSYDPDSGVVTILTTEDGAFRTEPLQNAVHEMVHMGIEGPIVRRFGLGHEEKERLVDLICLHSFRDLLPKYSAQPMGPPALDAFIDDASFADLPRAVGRYVTTRRP